MLLELLAIVLTTSAADVESRFKQDTDAYEHAFDRFKSEKKLDEEFHYNLSSLQHFLEAGVRSSDPEVRSLAALELVRLADYEGRLSPAVYRRAAALAPPSSAFWKMAPELIPLEATGLGDKAARPFLEALIRHNPDRLVQARAWIARAHADLRRGDRTAWERDYRVLATQYGDLKEIKLDLLVLNPDNKVAVGKRVPHFQLTSIDGARQLSDRDLLGKFYLVDFWATWCGPCLGELPALNRAFRAYQQRNFTVVSISVDKTATEVADFRAKRWSMPWENAFLPGGLDAPTAKDFEVNRIGLPRSVLVSPDGTILATQDELRRGRLEETLRHHLSMSPRAR